MKAVEKPATSTRKKGSPRAEALYSPSTGPLHQDALLLKWPQLALFNMETRIPTASQPLTSCSI